jgi:hypothetical protein
MAGYCARADVYAFGVPRGAIPNSGRLALSVDATANAFALGDHAFETGDPVHFRAEQGGSLPAPLVAGVVYYAIATTDDTFQVSATVGGPAIDLTTAGAEILVIAPLPIDQAIAYGARVIDQALVAHAVPLTAPYPELVVMTNAELAAGKLGHFSGGTSKSLADMIVAAQARLADWARGVPVRGDNTAPGERTNLAASLTAAAVDSRGWSRHGAL